MHIKLPCTIEKSIVDRLNNDPTFALDVTILKKDTVEQIAYGAALSLNLFDMDSEIILKEPVLRRGAHGWLHKSRKMNLYHKYSLEEWQSFPVESYISTHDLMVEKDTFIPCFPHYYSANGDEMLALYKVICSTVKDSTADKAPFIFELCELGIKKGGKGDYLNKDGNPVLYIPHPSWMLAIQVPDKDLWKMYENGTIAGFSVEGNATKRKVQI
jgi:hypothetical protein